MALESLKLKYKGRKKQLAHSNFFLTNLVIFKTNLV